MTLPVLSPWIGGREVPGSGRLGDVFEPATGKARGTEGVKFYTRTKTVTVRWPEPHARGTQSLAMPTPG